MTDDLSGMPMTDNERVRKITVKRFERLLKHYEEKKQECADNNDAVGYRRWDRKIQSLQEKLAVLQSKRGKK